MITLEELKILCAEKAALVEDPDPSIGFVLVMVAVDADDTAQVATATNCHPFSEQKALLCALEMQAERQRREKATRERTKGATS